MGFNLFCNIWMTVMMMIQPMSNENIIMTVRGPISAAEFGKVLVHEHAMCDFIGAENPPYPPFAKGERRRCYNSDVVVETMLPFLQVLKERGFTGFVDCTPAYIGRDAEVLQRLAELTDLHILTNTGYYGAAGDKFIPPHAFTETADQLAARWVKEWEQGIDETNIKPGFIKIGVDPGPLSEIDRKLVQAAAKTHLQTGLPIACHTGEAQAALGVLENVRSEGVDPSALIIVHADGISDQNVHFQFAEAGAWVEYDGVSDQSIERHVRLVKEMLERGFGNRLLLSHDAGWYQVGEPDGGKIRPYTAISDQLIPALKTVGVDDAVLRKLLIDNPAQAFTVRVRKQ
jgi:phosphotriesterase-related protein